MGSVLLEAIELLIFDGFMTTLRLEGKYIRKKTGYR